MSVRQVRNIQTYVSYRRVRGESCIQCFSGLPRVDEQRVERESGLVTPAAAGPAAPAAGPGGGTPRAAPDCSATGPLGPPPSCEGNGTSLHFEGELLR